MKKGVLSVLIVTVGLWNILGCATAVRYSPDEIKDYPPAVQEQIRQANVIVGMTPQQVRYSWGSPTTVNMLPLSLDGKLREEWLYSSSIFVQRRLLFVDGKLFDIFPEPKPAPAPVPEPQPEPQKEPQQPVQSETK
jgi:hypothetical protein